MTRPSVELGGEGDGANPEQLFAVGYAACFDGALRSVARRTKVDLGEVTVDAAVSLLATAGRRYGIGVELSIEIPALDSERAADLVREAHQVCPYSNATRGNVDVAPHGQRAAGMTAGDFEAGAAARGAIEASIELRVGRHRLIAVSDGFFEVGPDFLGTPEHPTAAAMR